MPNKTIIADEMKTYDSSRGQHGKSLSPGRASKMLSENEDLAMWFLEGTNLWF